MDIEIVCQDREVLVCRKPAGLLSQGEGEAALPTLLRRQAGGEIYPVHRLDRGTAGLMVFARTGKAAAALSQAIAAGKLEKTYLALVSGGPEPPAGELRDLLFKDRSGKVFPVSRPRKGVREARLTYETLARDPGTNTSLVRVTLGTGRTHQIRVQFASRGWPLWGDGKYGSRVKGPLGLFCCRLVFPHPGDGREMAFDALPQGAPWENAHFPGCLRTPLCLSGGKTTNERGPV